MMTCSKQKFSYKTLPSPHNSITYTEFTRPAIPLHEMEYDPNQKCSFEGFDGKNDKPKCFIEKDEHDNVKRYVKPNARVLELGGRFGTTSCVIASQLKNSGKQVTVEVDDHVMKYLMLNRESHFCNFYLNPFPIGNSTFKHAGKKTGYANRVIPDTASSSSSSTISHYTYEEIQKVVGFTFTTLLIDCEGCIQYIFQGNSVPLRDLLSEVDTILIEGDMPMSTPHMKSGCEFNCVNYDEWEKTFISMGFNLVAKERDARIKYIYHYVFKR